MEREKRKGFVEDERRDGKKKKKMVKNEKKKEEDPTDEEVDEFFRILKRMHVAMEYFGGVKSKSLISQTRCSAAMADEHQGLDEEEKEDDDDQGKRETHVEEICEREEKKIKSGDGMLDLNADPEQEL